MCGDVDSWRHNAINYAMLKTGTGTPPWTTPTGGTTRRSSSCWPPLTARWDYLHLHDSCLYQPMYHHIQVKLSTIPVIEDEEEEDSDSDAEEMRKISSSMERSSFKVPEIKVVATPSSTPSSTSTASTLYRCWQLRILYNILYSLQSYLHFNPSLFNLKA